MSNPSKPGADDDADADADAAEAGTCPPPLQTTLPTRRWNMAYSAPYDGYTAGCLLPISSLNFLTSGS
ncbi:unnamed protein product [Diplocarpon coronariae]